MVLLKIVSISLESFKIFDDLNFFKFFDEFCKNNQSAACLRMITISKIAMIDLPSLHADSTVSAEERKGEESSM